MSEHKIQSTDIADDGKNSKGFKERPEVLAEEEFDNFDSSPHIPRSKRLVVDLYVPLLNFRSEQAFDLDSPGTRSLNFSRLWWRTGLRSVWSFLLS